MDSGIASLLGLELAAVRGNTWLQSEWIRAKVHAPELGGPTFGGAYLEVGRFLTGERRPYDPKAGTFDRVEPNTVYRRGNPFREGGSRGAIEVTARYSTVDLTDAGVSGGEMRDLSVGLNWYLTAETRVTLNYVRSELRDVGTADIVLLRFQYNP